LTSGVETFGGGAVITNRSSVGDPSLDPGRSSDGELGWYIPGAPPPINAVLTATRCAAEVACLLASAATYPIGTYNPFGSNSNTYAATVARTCCKKPLPAGIPPLGPGQIAPGWNAAPPAPIPGVRVVKHT
jgi:hypothetical protein